MLVLFLFNLYLDFSNLSLNFDNFSSFKESLIKKGFLFQEAYPYPYLPSKVLFAKKNSVKINYLKSKEVDFSFTIPKTPRFGILEGGGEFNLEFLKYPENFLIIETLNFRNKEILKITYYPFQIDKKRIIYNPISLEYEEDTISLKPLNSLDTLRNFFSDFYYIFKLYIDSSGLYKITGKELKDAGLNLSLISPKKIRIFNIGDYTPNTYYPDTLIEIPYLFFGKDSNRFNEDDYILFYARGASSFRNKFKDYYHNLYTLYNIYWLCIGEKEGKRIKEVSSLPDRKEVFKDFGYEKRHIEFDRDCPARGGLLWIWDKIEKASYEVSKEISYSFEIKNAFLLDNLKFPIFCDSPFGFILKIYLDSNLIDTLNIPSALPPSGSLYNKKINYPIKDKINLKLLFYRKDKAMNFYTDYFEFIYLRQLNFQDAPIFLILDSIKKHNIKIIKVKKPIILDITDEFSPKILKDYLIEKDTLYLSYYAYDTTILYISDFDKIKRVKRIENKSYYRNSNIHLLSGDYLIICPSDLYYACRELKRYRDRESSCEVFKIEEIIDHYLFGIEEPYSLKKFFALKRPLYGCLVGDATYDYRGLLYNKPQIFTYEVGYGFDFNVYNTAIYALDSYFADFEGNGRSPDFVLTRLPLRNESELRDYLFKLKEYERNISSYKKRILFLADDEYKGSPSEPDEFRADHIRNCENIASIIPKDYDVEKLYLTEFPFLGEEDKTNARDEFVRLLNDKGFAFAFYFGHGAGFQIAHEKLLTLGDVGKVKARPNYPIGYFGSCGVGRFDDTKFEALSEELVRNKEGFIATIGAIKGTSPPGNEELLRRLVLALIYNNKDILGDAFYDCWQVNTFYHLFGEPLTKLNIPKRRDLNLEISEGPFLGGKKVEARINLKKGVEFSELSFSLGKRKRRYKSPVIDIFYNLSGEEIFQAKKILKDSFYNFSFIFPKGLKLDTIFLGSPENYYWEIPKTLKLSIFYKTKDSSFTFNIDTFFRDTLPYENFDTLPPNIYLYANNKILKDTSEVKKDFQLEIRAFDESGIFLKRGEVYSPKIIIEDEVIDLGGYFYYQDTFYYCKIPITLKRDFNNCRVIIYDNLLNKKERAVILKTKIEPKIEIKDLAVVRVKDYLYFTFLLNEGCLGSIKIYTLNGRKILEENNLIFNFGFNSVPIRIENLARGIYLYKLSLSSLERKEKKEIVNKLIIDY
ncbi:MAG: C25 family cysteine peptidase [candidate division WOR-3 bacterium]